jgi:acetyl-CoA C-acetyltransferase
MSDYSLQLDEMTPVIIGIGRIAQPAGVAAVNALSTLDMAEAAVGLALSNTGVGEAALRELDTLVCLRSQEDMGMEAPPFGKAVNFPAALAARLGARPKTLILAESDRTVPLSLLLEFGNRIASGEAAVALIVGAEAESVARTLAADRAELDWSDTTEGAMEDRGRGLGIKESRYATQHGLVGARANYDLIQNARAGRNASDAAPASIEASQGAAIVVTSVATACRMGVPSERCVYLAGIGFGAEPPVIQRGDVGRSLAAEVALSSALALAGRNAQDIATFQLQGGAAVALHVPALDALGLDAADPRAIFRCGSKDVATLEGIAALVERLRTMSPGAGLIGTDGGVLSRYAAAVLSTIPVEWPGAASSASEYPALAMLKVAHVAAGWAKVLSYALVTEGRTEPAGIVMGQLEDSGERFYALHADANTLAAMRDVDPIGRRIFVRWTGLGHRFAFDRATIERILPVQMPALRPSYEYILVERREHVLEVTINRPEVRNCLVPEAHAELSDVFDAFEADRDLWVAIITGAGTQAFCAGNDLKYSASGKPVWLPSGGFGGLVARAGRTKPIIAAVNGFAYGGGFEIAMASDIVVADATARFALSEVKVGLIATGGGLSQLPRQIPRKLATELILTARALDAEEAFRLGFVSRVEPAGEALAGARRIADAIASNSPTAIRLTLRAMREAEQIADPALAALSTVRSSLIDELLVSEDMVEGTRAFAAKRPPNWKNR